MYQMYKVHVPDEQITHTIAWSSPTFSSLRVSVLFLSIRLSAWFLLSSRFSNFSNAFMMASIFLSSLVWKRIQRGQYDISYNFIFFNLCWINSSMVLSCLHWIMNINDNKAINCMKWDNLEISYCFIPLMLMITDIIFTILWCEAADSDIGALGLIWPVSSSSDLGEASIKSPDMELLSICSTGSTLDTCSHIKFNVTLT